MYQWHRQFLKVFIQLFGFVCLSEQLTHTPGYSQVLVSGRDGANDEGPKIFKALNMDLIYPRTFNTSENTLPTTAAPFVAPVVAESMQQSPEQREQDETPYDGQSKPYAAEQPIFYVTPATNNAQQDIGENYENNIEISSPSHATDTAPPVSDISPVLPTFKVKEQSDVDSMPVEPSSILEENVSTGRAVDYNRPSYNFNQFITPLIKSPRPIAAPTLRERPVTPSNIGKIIYPQAFNQQRPPNIAEINKLSGKAPFSDRFTPGEAVASGQFTRHLQAHNHNHALTHAYPPNNGQTKVAAASQIVQQTYKPPENIYSFPPNINSHYKSPYQDPKAALPSSNVNSYAATPSGPIQTNSNYKLIAAASNNDAGYKYPGPTNPANLVAAGEGKDEATMPLSTSNDGQNDMSGVGGGADADVGNGSDDTIGVLPASAMDGDTGKDLGGKDAGADNAGDGVDAMAQDHDHNHPPPVDDTEYPTPPPGWMEEQPDVVPASQPFTHDSYPDIHSFHGNLPSYPQYFHHYPEIIYDDHHHHDHHTYPPPTLSPVTTEMPPPEPPPEPRVKKYSYFYIGRKLWYIPLYFTVWFSFYVLWLILKSIARHKVNLPNHYVSKRSLPDFGVRETRANEYINDLTVSVLEKIENFQHKYLT